MPMSPREAFDPSRPLPGSPVDHAPDWHGAGFHVLNAWECLSEARTLLEQATAIDDLANAMSDLVTWLPGYDVEKGTVPEESRP